MGKRAGRSQSLKQHHSSTGKGITELGGAQKWVSHSASWCLGFAAESARQNLSLYGLRGRGLTSGLCKLISEHVYFFALIGVKQHWGYVCAFQQET